ncbi:hypothetical protein SODALDRAFT_329401 [Sodiomyces alkalinus F11]|uniref:Ubiquitin-like domain-containing protein n=1 Tax=Sodiomyces alkalinus (strain CBS 110278 / VKM F-3762 / F11) TaxID=1314773 RepID=A0A3N2PLD5_SODAK|nr:hypothetical protein SODALDRAFT_329401 [Sodiomyces alkalinus F11]ROT35214.1 hypothetical protein SODALDRAFT_329401 [Sodiomyces alkalinus F11]
MAEAAKPVPATRPPLPHPLLLRIRFSTSLPDLDLDIPNPANTTVAALKHLIRDRLDPKHNTRRLRFIYQGRILQDGAALSTALPSPVFTPPRPSQADEHDFKGKGKGKGKAVERQLDREQNRVYVICSIGDTLTPSELADEAVAAQKPPALPDRSSTTPRQDASSFPSSTAASARQNAPANATTTTTTTTTTRPTPRGFDRFLAAGFTPAEVSQLHLQFRDIQAQRHTPDTMPSPDTLQSMEDSWVDANAGDAVPGGGTGAAVGSAAGEGAAGAADDGFSPMHDGLDGLIKGMVMGFFWPLGGLVWLTREEGIVSYRWRVWIGFGVSFSIFIGIMRALFGTE